MLDKIGEEFDGMISSVTNFGLFVELPNTIEGLVHVSYMTDDYYRFDEQHFAMIGERTGNVYRIGDEITVKVVNVNKDEHSIDFEIVGMKGTRRKSPKDFKFKTNRSTSEKGRGGQKPLGKKAKRIKAEVTGSQAVKEEKKNAYLKTHRNKNAKEKVTCQKANRASRSICF